MTKQLDASGGVVQSGQEVIPPRLRKGGGGNCLSQQVSIVFFANKELVHFGNRNAVVIPGDEFAKISFSDVTFLFHREIKSAASTMQKSLDHVVPPELGR